MPNTLNNSFAYTGQVTIKVKDMKSKKILETRHIKNAGTKNLFKFLCECLIGNYVANNRPRYLDASSSLYQFSEQLSQINAFETNLYYRSILSNPNIIKEENKVTLTSQITTTLENYHARYSAIILKNQMDETARTNGIRSLALFNSPELSDKSTTMLAWINITDDQGNSDPIEINDNQAILIEWDLSFDNYIKNIIE